MKRLSFVFITLVLVIVLLVVEVIIVRSASKYEPEVSIVYAAVKIPEGSTVEEGMLKEKKVNISMVHRRSVRAYGEVVGKKAIVDIEEGEMILSSKLVEKGRTQDIELKDKSNRLFSIEFKADQANGWWLEADQYVDIIFVPNRNANYREIAVEADRLEADRLEAENTVGEEPAEKLWVKVRRLRDIRVAALIDERGKIIKKTDSSSLPRYISFEVNEMQDEFLAYAKSNGRLELSVAP